MRLVLAISLMALGAGSALAEDCVYATGTGPSLTVDEDTTVVTVDFGDWTETCPLEQSGPRPNLGFGTGWHGPTVAHCKAFDTQFAYVWPNDAMDGVPSAIVFDGNAFYRRCD